jgi:hypothetical protein
MTIPTLRPSDIERVHQTRTLPSVQEIAHALERLGELETANGKKRSGKRDERPAESSKKAGRLLANAEMRPPPNV